MAVFQQIAALVLIIAYFVLAGTLIIAAFASNFLFGIKVAAIFSMLTALMILELS